MDRTNHIEIGDDPDFIDAIEAMRTGGSLVSVSRSDSGTSGSSRAPSRT
ncbi:MAG: hypothetical protein AAFP86_14545 [Planctomycetota bacterium]